MHPARRAFATTLTYIGLAGAAGIAPALAQNLFVSFDKSAVIQDVVPDGTSAATFYSGASGSRPLGLAFDASGNLFVANGGNDSIEKITLGGVASTFYSGASGSIPFDVAFDASGNLYVANGGDSTIEKITPTGSASTFYQGAGLSSPLGLAFDATGNLYVANNGNSTIERITPDKVASTFYSGASGSKPLGLAFDASGNLYVANSGSFSIEKITPGLGASAFYTSPVSGGAPEFKPNFLAFDGQGNLYATNNLNYQNFNSVNDGRFATVVKFSPDGTSASTFYSQDSTLEHAYGLAFSGRFLPNSIGAAPEPSEWAALGFTGLGIVGLLVKARRRGTGKGSTD